MMKKAVVMVAAMLVVVACGHNDTPSSPSQVSQDSSSALGGMPGATLTSPATPLLPRSQSRIGFGFNGTVSGFPTGEVFLTGGGAYQRESHFVAATGGFRCILAVLQGPLSTSINPNDPGACQDGQGVRWDTAALLDRTTFKCAASAVEETAATSDSTVVLQADFYRAGDGGDESFTAKMIVSSGERASRSAATTGSADVWARAVETHATSA